uniref:Uncharacterized protein n=1 Tax=Tanacetum cinerariifolium TaxID=118510 RepID=A0A6L2LQ57_TANCI|nr:hypothetical protein [Tanacetum cinerariifolium]
MKGACSRKQDPQITKTAAQGVVSRNQQIFDELVYSQRLTEAHLEAFRDCALQDINLGECPSVDGNWLCVVSSQGLSLLSADLSGSELTDIGLCHVKDCKNLEDLNLNFCDKIMDVYVGCISGLKKLEALNINCYNCITDVDMKPLSELTNLKELKISCSKVTDHGVTFLNGLRKLALLNMERCLITSACLDSLSDLHKAMIFLISSLLLELKSLKILNMGFNDISDVVLAHLKDGGLQSLAKLSSLKSINLDVRQITDAGLAALTSIDTFTLSAFLDFAHLLMYGSILFMFQQDTKKLLEAVEKRFGGNATTKKTQRNLLKQQYKNFIAQSSEMLDQTFDRLQKLIRQLELLKNKAYLDTMSMDNLYNNLKVYEPEVKEISSSSSSTQKMAFVSSSNNNTSSTNGAVNTAQAVNIAHGVSTASTQVNTVYSTNIDNLKVSNDSTCLKSCLETAKLLKSQNDQLLKDLKKSELMVLGYKTGEIANRELRKKLEIAQKEKDGIQLNVDKFKHAFKSLNKLIECQIIDNYKKGLGYENYNAVPPPYTGNFMPPTSDLSFTGLDEFFNKLVVETCKAKSSEEEPKVVRKNDDALIIEEKVSDNEEEDVSHPKIEKKIVRPSIAKIEFVKSKQQEKLLNKLRNIGNTLTVLEAIKEIGTI